MRILYPISCMMLTLGLAFFSSTIYRNIFSTFSLCFVYMTKLYISYSLSPNEMACSLIDTIPFLTLYSTEAPLDAFEM